MKKSPPRSVGKLNQSELPEQKTLGQVLKKQIYKQNYSLYLGSLQGENMFFG